VSLSLSKNHTEGLSLDPSLVRSSVHEQNFSRMTIVEQIAPVAAACQLVFGVWFSFTYGSIGHLAGFLWLAVLFISVTPEILRIIPLKAFSGKTGLWREFGILRALSQGVVWGAFPLLLAHVAGHGESLIVFLAYSAIVSITAIYHFSRILRGIAFLIPTLAGMVTFTSTGWMFSHMIPLPSFLTTAFVLTTGLGLLLNRQAMKDVEADLSINKRNNIINLLRASGTGGGNLQWLFQLDEAGYILNPPKNFIQICEKLADHCHKKRFIEIMALLSSETGPLEELGDKFDSAQLFFGMDVSLSLNDKAAFWSISAIPSKNKRNEVTGHVVLITDNTVEMEAQEERSRLALSDPLTGLMNRARFSEEIERETAKLERYGTNFTLMFLDLDKFKLVNDMRGHLVGDKLLIMVAERILSVVRTSDSVARLGGDEFAILMRDECDAGAAAKLAARLLQIVGKKYEIDGEYHSIGVSIGIALAPMNGTRPNQLLRNADLALYRSKEDGRGVFRFFESQMDADQREKRLLELELREALDDNQFELFYQPLISTSTGRATAMEALIRWNHPIRGRISPDEFMPIAEQTSLIQEIGNWTIREACSKATQWPNEMRVSINLSAQHLIGSDIVQITKTALEESGLPPEQLELEITESLFINNVDEATQLLNALKDLGVDIVLDDFGTGYSSLSYLLQFPFDKIKIDRSFVMASTGDSAARAILRMISGLGEQLGMRITAEGVESIEQVEFLKSIKCDEFQGFYFAKPLDRALLDSFIDNEIRYIQSNNDNYVSAQA